MKILCSGDLHITTKGLLIFKKFEQNFLNFIERYIDNIDMIVLLGDILHSMDLLKTVCMNTALEFFKQLEKYGKPIYILVGNHDYIGPNEILSKNHWMAEIEFGDTITIVDSIIQYKNLLFMPYIPPGRFNQLLQENNVNLKEIDYIFCHQEFKGAEFEFSVIKSENGDLWEKSNPTIISGHIHKKQWLQENIYYVGTPYQTRFNENLNKSIALLDTNTKNIQEFDLKLPKLITLSKNIEYVEELINYLYIPENLYKIIITSPSLVETQLFVKNQIYKKLTSYSNITILFNYTKEVVQQKTQNKALDFKTTLYENIKHNDNMINIYKELID